MTNLANKPPIGLKDKSKKQKNERFLQSIRSRRCIICKTFNEVQMSATTAHHPIHDRYSTRKRSDLDAIPLCEGHHQGLWDSSKVAIHRQPKLWRELYGPDYSYSDHPTEF